MSTMKEITLKENFDTRLFHGIYFLLREIDTPKGIEDENHTESFLCFFLEEFVKIVFVSVFKYIHLHRDRSSRTTDILVEGFPGFF